jgi:hypothetical protein
MASAVGLAAPLLALVVLVASFLAWHSNSAHAQGWRALTQLSTPTVPSCARAQLLGAAWAQALRQPQYEWSQRYAWAELMRSDRSGATKNAVWGMLPPAWADPALARYGGAAGQEGSKALHNLENLRAPCVVYSWGGNLQTEFEEAMLAQTPCSVWIFDCTVGAEEYAPVIAAMRGAAQRLFFKPYCAGREGARVEITGMRGNRVATTLRSVRSVMAELGHARVDLLKVDVEGAEHVAIPDLLRSGAQLPPQISFELHHSRDADRGGAAFWAPVAALVKAGYQLVSREDNILAPYCCTELTFVKDCAAG